MYEGKRFKRKYENYFNSNDTVNAQPRDQWQYTRIRYQLINIEEVKVDVEKANFIFWGRIDTITIWRQ